LRGVSEYTATLIVAIITLAAGAAIFIYSYAIVDSYYSALLRASEEVEQGSSAAILASYIALPGTLVVIGSTGSSPATPRAVYINESLATACSLYFNNTSVSLPQSSATPTPIPPYTAFVIKCPVGSATEHAFVKLVFDGGEAIAKAGRIG